MNKVIIDIPRAEVEQNVLQYKDIIIEGSKSSDSREKSWSIYYMIMFPLVFRKNITELIENGSKIERIYIAELIQNNFDQYKHELSKLLKDKEPDVRLSAVKTFGLDINLNKNEIIKALDDRDKDVKIAALRVLSPLFDEYKGKFLELAEDEDISVAQAAAVILLNQKNEEDKAVEKLLTSSRPEIQSLVLSFIVEKFEKYKEVITKTLHSENENAVNELVHRLPQVRFEELKEDLSKIMLKSRNYRVSSTILYKFGENLSKYKDQVVEALEHENQQIRQSAFFHIKNRPSEFKEKLGEIFEKTKEISVKEDLVGLFGQESQLFSKEVIKVLKSNEEKLLKRIFQNLSAENEEVKQLVVSLLENDNKVIRANAIEYIAKNIEKFNDNFEDIVLKIFSKLSTDKRIDALKSIAYHLK
jgi:hypothetical protein